MDVKKLFGKATDYLRTVREANQQYYDGGGSPEPEPLCSDIEVVPPTTQLDDEPLPEETIAEEPCIKEPDDAEPLNEAPEQELPDFEEVRASWMIRNQALMDEVAELTAKITALENEYAKQLDVLKRENDVLLRQLDNRPHQDQLDRVTATIYQLQADAERKKNEIAELDKSISKQKEELSCLIREKTSHDEVTVIVPKGRGAILQLYADIHGKSLNDLLLKAVEDVAPKEN